jgi:hypothetical protein
LTEEVVGVAVRWGKGEGFVDDGILLSFGLGTVFFLPKRNKQKATRDHSPFAPPSNQKTSPAKFRPQVNVQEEQQQQ